MDVKIDTQEQPTRLLGMETMHMKLFRWGMLLLVYFAIAFSGLAWERAQNIGISFDAVPLGASVLVCLFVLHAFRHAQGLSRLRSQHPDNNRTEAHQ
jgi:hypothetical protein